jgi:hypothetical protein
MTVVKFPSKHRRRDRASYDDVPHVRADTLMYSVLYQGIVQGRHQVAQQLLDCLQGEHLGKSVVPLPDHLVPYVSHLVSAQVIQQMTSDWNDWVKENEAVAVPSDDSCV